MKLEKFGVDLCFNYVSLALLACSGVLINLTIVEAYGTSTLGQFNLIYAYYILISQFSVLGIHYAVLRNLALDTNHDLTMTRKIITSGIVLVCIVSIGLSVAVYHLSFFINALYSNQFLFAGIRCFSFAIPLFAINKTILAAYNGKRHMKLFAMGQGCRYLFMLTYIAIVAYFQLSEFYLFYVFFISELLLFIVLLPILFFYVLASKLFFCKSWMWNLLTFGLRAFLSGVFIEINSRIDVIILAYFVSSSQVGIYSFAAMIAEGFAMMLVVVRNNVNPIIANLLEQRNYIALREFMTSIRKHTYVFMTATTSLVFIGYLFLVYYIIPDAQLASSWPVLLIISASIALSSGFLPFSDFLTQANKPSFQSIQNLLVVISNVLLNITLTPRLGIIGAAISAGLSSYVISVLLIDWFARKSGLRFMRLHQLNPGYYL